MSNKQWNSTNLRLGASPLELQQLEKQDKLNPHLNVSNKSRITP